MHICMILHCASCGMDYFSAFPTQILKNEKLVNHLQCPQCQKMSARMTDRRFGHIADHLLLPATRAFTKNRLQNRTTTPRLDGTPYLEDDRNLP